MIRISIIGPECSGKTSLAQLLASHFHALLVPEYAREFVAAKKLPVTFQDLYEIAVGQQTSEERLTEDFSQSGRSGMLIADTDLHVIRIWSEIAFEKCDNRILSRLADDKRDLYLLTYPDLPWEADGQRVYPDDADRKRIFHHYLDTMVGQKKPFVVIRGQGESRVWEAIKAVDRLISARPAHLDPA